MPAVTFNLDNITTPDCLFAVERGATYNSLTLLHPDDVSTYTPCGEIRDNYLYLGGTLLATFDFAPLVYGLVTLPDNTQAMRTLIIPSLTALATSTLVPTKDRTATDRVRLGINAYTYDIKIQAPTGEIYKLVEGFVQVTPDTSGCLTP